MENGFTVVWQTRAHAAAFEKDPVYATFADLRAALSTAPVLAFFVHMSGNPRRCLESPVTEVAMYKVQDAVAEKTQHKIRDLAFRAASVSVGGLLALSWGAALEDLTRGANIIGWNTVEVRAFFFFRSGSFLILARRSNICLLARSRSTRFSCRRPSQYSSKLWNSTCHTYTSSYMRPPKMKDV
jgi:hypothetical protein